MNKKKLIRAIILYVVIAIVVIALIVGNVLANRFGSIITIFLNQENTKIVEGDGDTNTDYYTSEYSSAEALHNASLDFCQELEENGAVLLKNNGALPLATSSSTKTKISMFGTASADMLRTGGGSGTSSDTSGAKNFYDSLTSAGYDVNKTLYDFYDTGEGAKHKRGANSATADDGSGRLYTDEVPLNEYTDAVKASYASGTGYDKNAVIVLCRTGSEGLDLINFNVTDTSGETYLALSKVEIDMIKYVKSLNFETVTAVIMSAHAMELGWLDEYGIDACLWVGSVGRTGAMAVGTIMSGKVNPSGHLVDTYAYSATSAPSYQNYGNFYIDENGLKVYDKYGAKLIQRYSVVEAEGIYVGYKYYETRYADTVYGTGNADASVGSIDGDAWNYTKEVQYTFGHGLSYSDFTTTFNGEEKTDAFEFTGTVTNTNNIAGKEVLQVYLQKPYTDYDKTNCVEKAGIELVGFAKVSVDANGTANYKVTVDKEVMRSYDYNKAKTYIVDDGDYYFALGNDAHDALNNILAKQGKTVENGMDKNGDESKVFVYNVAAFDSTTYSKSNESGSSVSITNHFDDANIQTYDSNFKYLTRNNWKDTYPEPYTVVANQTLLDAINAGKTFKEDTSVKMPTTGSTETKVNLIELKDKDYDDPLWDKLLDQLSPKTMYGLCSVGGYTTAAIGDINKPKTSDLDGPSGISGTLVGSNISTMTYPCEPIIAATWDVYLVERLGEMVGEDSLATGVSGWYAPACNIHRSPFLGRNGEYFSEDSFISGVICAAEVEGCASKGLYCYVKHFALNEQETNRWGVMTFSNEQAIREIYLGGFEGAVRKGGANAIMSSYNWIGGTWAGAHKGLLTDVLRNEWGFKGMVITDYAAGNGMNLGLVAGGDLWLVTDTSATSDSMTGYSKSATLVNALRNATKNILYVVVNSNAMNGIGMNTNVIEVWAPWQYWLLVADIVVFVGAAVGVFFITKVTFFSKKKENDKEGADI